MTGADDVGRDEDGWMWGKMTGFGLIGDNGMMAGAEGGASRMIMDPPDPVPKGVGLGMNMGDGLLIFLLCFLRSV